MEEIQKHDLFPQYVSTQNENWDSNTTEMDGYWTDIQCKHGSWIWVKYHQLCQNSSGCLDPKQTEGKHGLLLASTPRFSSPLGKQHSFTLEKKTESHSDLEDNDENF